MIDPFSPDRPTLTQKFTLKGWQKVVISFAAAAVAVGAAAAATLWTFRQIESASAAREFTTDLVIRANALQTHILDAERSQRGYALTGDQGLLEPYLVLSQGIRSELKVLRFDAAARPSLRHIEALMPLVETKLAQMAEIIALRRNQDLNAVLARSADRAGDAVLAAINREAGAFIQAETRELQRYREESEAGMTRMLYTILVICGLSLLLPLSFSFQIYEATRRRVKDLVLAETRRLLEVQEDVNRQLKQANLTLHVSEEKLAVTLNSIDDAVIATDATGLVTFLNPLAERLTGWTRAQADGKPVEAVFRILNSDTREPIALPVQETLARGTTLSLAEHTLAVARDGGECDIADSCAPIRDRDGQVVGAVLVFRDVTERKRMDLALREKNALLEAARAVADKANLAKSDFLSSMSHELRTPLNAILGFAQLMESGAPPPTPAQKRSLDQILKAGWYLLELINEVLDLAAIESGRVSLSREPVSLPDVMLECRSMVEPQAHERGIRMQFPRFDGVPCFVNADRTRVKQVLINLLFNAIKYNAAGGLVTVECAVQPGERLRISVRDTGRGLAPEQLAQLFQPFNRLGMNAAGEQGTGIGLVVTKRLVEMMGGSIGVDSAVGAGSTFWIELELAQAQALSGREVEAGAAAQLRSSDGAPLRTLLYVEDNPANLELVEQLIARRPDLRLLSAADAATGIALARAGQPEAILMDINLPGLSGVEAMQILRLDPATAHIPIIALSANAMVRDVNKALAAGFFDYLTKPIKVAAFMAALDAALQFSGNAAAGRTPPTKEAA